MNSIEKLTLNYRHTENRLASLNENALKKRNYLHRKQSSSLLKSQDKEQAKSIGSLAHMLNKIHFDKIRVVHKKKSQQMMREKVKVLKTEQPVYGINTKGSMAQQNLINIAS